LDLSSINMMLQKKAIEFVTPIAFHTQTNDE